MDDLPALQENHNLKFSSLSLVNILVILIDQASITTTELRLALNALSLLVDFSESYLIKRSYTTPLASPSILNIASLQPFPI